MMVYVSQEAFQALRDKKLDAWTVVQQAESRGVLPPDFTLVKMVEFWSKGSVESHYATKTAFTHVLTVK